ncbi:hypothetical protein AVEN_155052-1 [Araneus ventricosus]|uniref:Uncharacterized protein n=1 Tax=Araneus ventricosus TaxID=182803 RepID=A0A4Y2A872_ARAVE|nr:hypothetical protein AVEN_155052-1 [Araneus ventricosus]
MVNIVTKIVLWVYGGKQTNKQNNGERRFIHKYSGEHEAQVGVIVLIQISNVNSQQLTSNISNSTFGFSNTNSQKITNNASNSTFNSAQLTSFPASTAAETPKSSFTLRRRSKSINTHTVIRERSFYSLHDRP